MKFAVHYTYIVIYKCNFRLFLRVAPRVVKKVFYVILIALSLQGVHSPAWLTRSMAATSQPLAPAWWGVWAAKWSVSPSPLNREASVSLLQYSSPSPHPPPPPPHKERKNTPKNKNKKGKKKKKKKQKKNP